MKLAFVFLAGLIALTVWSPFSTVSQSESTSIRASATKSAELELIEDVQRAEAVELALQPAPPREPEAAQPPDPAAPREPATGSPSDRVIPPPAASAEAKCGSEPPSCGRKVRCCRMARCRSGCGLFRRR
jgi:hypothetical protein